MIPDEPKQNTITVSNSAEEKATFEFHWDAGLEDWAHIFRSILYWVTFHPETINLAIPNTEETEDITDETE